MADISVLSRLVNGLNRNITLSSNTLVVGNIKVGGDTNYATFDVAALTAARTITMPNTDVDLGDIATNTSNISSNSSTLSSHLDGTASKHDGSEIDFEYDDGSKKNIDAASDDIENAIIDLDDAIGALTASPSNYSPSDASIVADHLSAIDTALASAGGTDFSDSDFRISDNGDSTKKIAFEASAITTSTLRTITMPDADVDLGNIANLITLSGVAADSTDLGAFSGSVISDNQTIKAAIQALETYAENTRSIVNNFEFYNSALDYVVDNTVAPATEVSGDRYVLSHDGGVPHADYDGASAGDIVEFDGSSWVATTPATGSFISVDDDGSGLYQWSGSAWSFKYFESTTASGLLTKDGFDIKLASSTAANIIVYNASGTATSVAMSGEASISNAGAITLDNDSVIAKVLTGYSAGAGTVAATDSILEAIQKLDGNIQANDSDISGIQDDVSNLVTLSGVAVDSTNLGTFTGDTIADSQTIKQALQALETKVETVEDEKNEEVMVAGESFAANSSFVVRLALNGETAGRIYKADKDAGAQGSETNTIYLVGIAQNKTGSSISAGSSIDVVLPGGKAVLQSSDTQFTASQDEGLPVYLVDDGAFSVTAPSSSNEAAVIVGTVENVGASSAIRVGAGFGIQGIN